MQLAIFEEGYVDKVLEIIEDYLGLAFNVVPGRGMLLGYAGTPYSFVLLHGARVVGVVLSRVLGGRASIDVLAVRPEFSGMGYGKLLLRRCLEALRERGVGSVELTVPVDAVEGYRPVPQARL